MNGAYIQKCDLTKLNSEVLDTENELIIKPYSFYQSVDKNELKYFMLQNGIYVMPTQELIDWLKQNIVGNAIEIGAGNGAISRKLGIPITDSRMQERSDIKFFYNLSGQPTIKYPDDVEKLEAIEAINKYKPDTTIGAFITHKFDHKIGNGNAFGVDEELLLSKVKKYINICNKITHKDKPILKLEHEEFQFEWLITRAVNQSENAIFVFEKNLL